MLERSDDLCVTSFVYIVKNKITGEIYVGKSDRPAQRWAQHLKDAFHYNLQKHFSRAIRKYGADDFEMWVQEECQTSKEAIDAEVELIAYFKWLGASLYNATDGGEGFSGLKRSPEHCRKISEAKKNQSPEARRMIGAAMRKFQTGRKWSAERKAKASEAARHRIITPEARAKMSEASRKKWERYRELKKQEKRQ